MIIYQHETIEKEELLLENGNSKCVERQHKTIIEVTMDMPAIGQIDVPSQLGVPPPESKLLMVSLLWALLGLIAGMTQFFSPETWTYLQPLLETLFTLFKG